MKINKKLITNIHQTKKKTYYKRKKIANPQIKKKPIKNTQKTQ